MNWMNVRIERLRDGQPRPYADSVCEARMIFTQELGSGLWTPTRDQVIAVARSLIHGWADGPNLHPLETFLKELIEESPGVWRIEIVSPYND